MLGDSELMGLPRLVSKYVTLMYEYSKVLVRTAAGTATSVVRRGFKQGGRFSTTAAKLALMGNQKELLRH